MILVDTSIWIDHLRAGSETLATLLDQNEVLTHPFVIGELALGSFRQRGVILRALRDLSRSVLATDEEVVTFIDRYRLFGTGIGYVDAHLLTAVRLTDGATLWSRDVRLARVAEQLGVAARFQSA